jgi:SAM-dependent methyltransferase
MSSLDATGPNAEQIEYWNAQAGPKWLSFAELLDDQLAPLGLAAMDRAKVAAGERVLDVGCGCGQTSLQLAERVGAAGAVTGIDLSTAMLAHARGRAAAAGLRNVVFENADAQIHAFPAGSFDLAFSRFGVMFFEEPTTAFANLRGALREGGRMAFVCWRSLSENQWLRVPLLAAASQVELPAPPPEGAPGPFSFARRDRLEGILTGAGFRERSIEPLDGELTVGGGASIDRVVDFMTQMGPAGRLLGQAAPDVRARATEALREAIQPFTGPTGIRMKYAAWIVTGRI